MLKRRVNHWKMSLSRCPAAHNQAAQPALRTFASCCVTKTGQDVRRFLAAFICSLTAIMPARAEVSAQWARAQSVTVIMVDNRFQPDHLAFHANQPYQLRLENHGKEMHEFTAPAFLKTSEVRDKSLLSNGGTDIVVQPGKSVTVFLYPRSRGQYGLSCADHDWDGMVGAITVK